jgi:hypothetical protein
MGEPEWRACRVKCSGAVARGVGVVRTRQAIEAKMKILENMQMVVMWRYSKYQNYIDGGSKRIFRNLLSRVLDEILYIEPMMLDQHYDPVYLVFSPDFTQGSTSLNDAKGFGDFHLWMMPLNDWKGSSRHFVHDPPYQGSFGDDHDAG